MQIVGYLIVLVIALIIIAVVLYFAVLIVAGTLAILCLVAVAVYGPKVAVWVRAEHFKRKGGWAGTPDIALDRWNWQNGPTCAINAQRVILSLFGVDKSEVELAGRQQAYGRYSKKKGTSDVSFVLEGYGLKVRRKSKKSRWLFSEMWSGLRSGRLYKIGRASCRERV